MIDTVLLDLDDTILDFHYAESTALCRLLEGYGILPTEETVKLYSEINDAHWKRLERGEMTRREVQIGRFAELFERLGIERSPEEANRQYMQGIAACGHMVNGAEAFLQTLRAAHIRVYIVSNGSASVQYGRMAAAGITDFFDGIFLSEEIGYEKPKREFFDRCTKQIPQFDPAKTIILGDSLTSDILGGINARIETCWFNPRGKKGREDIVPDHEINDLSDFLALILNR